jgi:hypothetical protein
LLEIRRNRHLQLSLYTLHEVDELGSRAKTRKVAVWGNGHVRFERHMILSDE